MFPNIPDGFLHMLFGLAAIVLAVCGLAVMWIAYHIARALLIYVGVIA